MTQKKRPQKHGPSASTILIFLFLFVFFYGSSKLLKGEIRIGGGYDGYSGPIMPLTTVSGGEDLTAERAVDFDFSTYGEEHDPTIYDPAEVLVTDTYRLTNTTSEDKTVELAYPYVIQPIMERGFLPTITVEGQEVQPEIYFTMDTGRDFIRAEKFDDYKKLMAEKDYFASAMEEPVIEDIPVKAYHFTDITYNGDRKGNIPFLTVTFTIPEGVNVWTRHFDVLKDGEGEDSYSLWFRDDLDEKDQAWVFMADGDIENLTFGGNLGHNVTQNSALTDVTCEYEIVETTFADLMWKFAQEYDHWAEDEDSTNHGLITPEILYRDTMKILGGNMGKGYDPLFGQAVKNVEDKFYFTFMEPRLQYMVFPVTIPAGETLTVEAKYWKEASYFFSGTSKEGYEIATQLDSNLTFTDLSATIRNTQWVEIQDQDLGFSPETGVTRVPMNLPSEQYYLMVCHKSKLP